MTTATKALLAILSVASTSVTLPPDAAVALACQKIIFGPLNSMTYGTPPFTISATASSGLAVMFVSDTTPVCTVSGDTLTLVAAGTCSITAIQGGNATYAPALPVTQTFTVNPAVTGTSAPSITSGGIVPVDSTVTTIQPGEWVSIFGAGLASSTASWSGNFPISLGGTTVTIHGRAAYLSFVSPGQINVQAPNDTATGVVAVTVTTAGGSSTATVTLAPFGPSFLLLDSKHVAGIIIRSNGSGAYGGGTYDIIGPTGTSLGYPTVAAKPGDVVTLYGSGLGPTSPAAPAGQPFSGAAPTTNPVTLVIGTSSVLAEFAGLTGAGLYQINLTVPAGLGTGDVPLVAAVGGVETPPTVVISLQP